MSQEKLEARLSEKLNISKSEADRFLNNLIKVMEEEIKETGELRIPKLGIFKTKERAARMGRNPKTGEPVAIPASKVVRFKAWKNIRDAVNA